MRIQQLLQSLIPITIVSASNLRYRDHDEIQQSNEVNQNIIPLSNGTSTKIMVRMKEAPSMIFDDNMKKTVEVNLDDSILMGLEINDESMIESLYDNSNVLSIEPDYEIGILDDVPNDKQSIHNMMRSLQETVPYGVDLVLQNRIKFENLKPKGEVKICIADTGYDINHADLPKSPNVIGKDGLGENWSYDGDSHGTHIAGIIGGVGNNKGITGIFPHDYNGKFQMLITKGLDKNGSGYTSDLIDALEDCVQLGANVISLSIGCNNCYSKTMDKYFQSLETKDIIVVASAGNSGNKRYNYPASYKSVISIASIDSNKEHSWFSQNNDQIELSAPGIDILSTVPGGKYEMKDGTSMAAPHAAGVAALLRMFYPQCKSTQIRKVMAYTAMDLDDKGCDTKTGFGLVQAHDAFLFLKNNGCLALEGETTGGCYGIRNKKKMNRKRKVKARKNRKNKNSTKNKNFKRKNNS